MSHLMFDSAVFSLGIFTYGNQVNIVIEGLVALNGAAGADISIQTEHPGKMHT